MGKRIGQILKSDRAASFPMTIGIVLALIILLCGISEYFRLQVIAVGVRDAVEDAIISTVNDNYAGVYHGVREGYSGSYLPFGDGDWEETLDEGNIYRYLDETLGTTLRGGRHVKYGNDAGTAGGNAPQRTACSFGSGTGTAIRGGCPDPSGSAGTFWRKDTSVHVYYDESTGGIYRSILKFREETGKKVDL